MTTLNRLKEYRTTLRNFFETNPAAGEMTYDKFNGFTLSDNIELVMRKAEQELQNCYAERAAMRIQMEKLATIVNELKASK